MDPHGLLLAEWCDQVAKRTNGYVKVNYHPGSTLTPIFQTFDSVVNELVDIGQIIPTSTPGRFPPMGVMDQPFGVKAAVPGTRLVRDVITKSKPSWRG
jgi:TRAP-type C4-dicarboxylate transport system substrate-binding protein